MTAGSILHSVLVQGRLAYAMRRAAAARDHEFGLQIMTPSLLPACEVFRIEGEKIKSSSHYFDMLTLLKQIGAMEGAAPAKSAA